MGEKMAIFETNMLHTRFRQQLKQYSKLIRVLNLIGQFMQIFNLLKN